MSTKPQTDKAAERYSETANDPPVDGRKPPRGGVPGSHSTGGAKDHARPEDDDSPEGPAGH